MIRSKDWQNDVRTDGSWSGALRNPGKTLFLDLAAESVGDVNQQRTKKVRSATPKKQWCGVG